MGDTVREADQRIVASRCGVDALGIRGRQFVKNLHLALDKPVALGVGEPDCSSHALAFNRVDDVLFNTGEHRLKIFCEMGTHSVDRRCVPNEWPWRAIPVVFVTIVAPFMPSGTSVEKLFASESRTCWLGPSLT